MDPNHAAELARWHTGEYSQKNGLVFCTLEAKRSRGALTDIRRARNFTGATSVLYLIWVSGSGPGQIAS